MTERKTMNGKPVINITAKTVINFKSAFKEKLLCDGLTFSTGTACAFSCSYCYVPSMMQKSPHMRGIDQPHHEVVVRRADALEIMRKQLVGARGLPKFDSDDRVIYASPLVDIAANMDLVRDTVAACKMILEMTGWTIRLLSKSPLIKEIAMALVETEPRPMQATERVIYGLSVGTLDDGLGRAIEQQCPAPSKRIEALRWLQDNGFRTFGMICPSLPQKDPTKFAAQMFDAIRGDRCEHVWAEVMNVRGDSMIRTMQAMTDAGYTREAAELKCVMSDGIFWEAYARDTFCAHAAFYKPGQLRFLQYVEPLTKAWWESRQSLGAVLLGVASHG